MHYNKVSSFYSSVVLMLLLTGEYRGVDTSGFSTSEPAFAQQEFTK